MKLLNWHQEITCRKTGGKYEKDESVYEQISIHEE